MNARADELDQMDDGRACASLTYEFPGWKIYRAPDRLCYAAHMTQPVTLRGEDWVALRDAIIGWGWRHDEGSESA